jgi:non-heme chloroperoxidase
MRQKGGCGSALSRRYWGAPCSHRYCWRLAGNTQGGSQDLRTIFQIAKEDSSGWKATMYGIDRSTDAIPVSSAAQEGSSLKLSVEAIHGIDKGKVSADGASIDGTWTQGQPLPVVMRRATKETAWPVDAASHLIQFIAVDRDVKLEVLDWGGSGRPVVVDRPREQCARIR